MADQEKAPVDSETPVAILTSENRPINNNVGLEEYLESKRLGIQLTPDINRRIRRKIDARILCLFFITSALQFLDTFVLNFANLFFLRDDLHLTSIEFSWLASARGLGALLGQFPASYLLTKFRTGKLMGTSVILWGITTLSFAFTHNSTTAIVCQLFLGIFQAPIPPAVVLGIGYWWTRNEAPFRNAIIYSAVGWAGIIGSLMSTGISKLSDEGLLARWQLMFVILGSITIVWGLLVFGFLPESPVDAKFLTHEEKLLATQRLAGNQVGIKSGEFKLYQVKQAIFDIKTWTIVLGGFASGIPNTVISVFSTELIANLGFSQTRTTLMNCVGSAFLVVGVILCGYIATHIRNTRIVLITIGNVTCLIAAACLAFLPRDKTWSRLIAFWWANLQAISLSLTSNMLSANIAGHTKKQFTSALAWIAVGLGIIIGPQFVLQKEAPDFPTATKAMMICFAVETVCHAVLGAYLLLSNMYRDRQQGSGGINIEEAEYQGMQDKTEFESKALRYVL